MKLTGSRRNTFIILSIIIAGCLIRLLLALLARPEITPFDDLDYLRRGLYFSRGNTNDCWRAPMQIWFTGILMSLSGFRFLVVRLAQSMVVCLSLPLMYLLARKLSSTRISLISLIISTLWLEFLTYSIVILSEGLSITLLTGAVLLTISAMELYQKECNTRSIIITFLAGSLWGLAALTRDEFFVISFIMIIPFWIFYRHWRKALPVFVIFIAGVMCCVAPYTARNIIKRHSMVIITNHGAYNLWQHWNSQIPSKQMNEEFFKQPEPIRQRYALRKALENLKDNPSFCLQQGLKSFARMWAPDNMMAVVFYYGFFGRTPPLLPVIGALLISFMIVILVIGFVMNIMIHWRSGRHWVLYGIILSSLIIHAIAYGQGRYRVPWMPLLIICGAQGIKELYDSIIVRRMKRVIVSCIAGVILLIFCCSFILKETIDLYTLHHKRGAEYQSINHLQREMSQHFYKMKKDQEVR